MSRAKDLGTVDPAPFTTDSVHIKQENALEQETKTEREETDISRISSALVSRSLESSRKQQFTYLACQLNLTPGAYNQWKRIGSERGFSSDTDTACFLMQHYQDCMSGFQTAASCSVCHAPLALSCPKCKDSRRDGASFSIVPGHSVSTLPYCEAVNNSVAVPAAQLDQRECGSDNLVIDSKSAEPDFILSSLSHCKSVNSRVALPAAHLQQNNGATEHGADSSDSDTKSEDPDFTIKVKFAPSCARGKRGRPPKRAAARKAKQSVLPPDPRASSAKPLSSSSTSSLPPSPLPRLFATDIIASAAKPRHQKTQRFHRKPKRHKGVVSVSEAEAGKLRPCEDHPWPVTGDDDDDDSDDRVTGEEGQVISISQEGKSMEELMQPGPGQRRGRKPTKNVKSVECPQCGARFTRKDALKVHMRVHTGERPYQCDMCAETFSLRASWVVHKRKHNNERPYVCKECGLTFNLAATLNQHIKLHSGVRPFLCTLCPKSFHRSGDLNTHMRSHTGFKPYLCQDCGKSFPISSDLNKHRILVHTDSKPFECQYCHKCFPFSHRLKTHMRIHTGEKDFLCTICGAKFAHKNNLTTHFRQHTGEKPYQCEVEECGKRFADYGNLCKHRRTSHGGTGKKPKTGQNKRATTLPLDDMSQPIKEPSPLLHNSNPFPSAEEMLTCNNFFPSPSSSSSSLPLNASSGAVFPFPPSSKVVAFPMPGRPAHALAHVTAGGDVYSAMPGYADFSQAGQIHLSQLGAGSYV